MPPVPLPEIALRLAVAALAGLAVGVEREGTAKTRGLPQPVAGVRTFLLLGVLGAIAAQLSLAGFAGAAVALVAGTAGLIVVAYAAVSRRGDVDATTEVAALVVTGAGAFAGFGWLAVDSGLSVVTALVLLEKSRIHDLVFRIRSAELAGGTRFAVLALVILPLLPEGPFGPAPGVRPREIWSLVLLFSGLSFASFIALRVAGPAKGYGVSGLLGGLISSTAVSLSFSRESAKSPQLGAARIGAAGAALASADSSGVGQESLDRARALVQGMESHRQRAEGQRSGDTEGEGRAGGQAGEQAGPGSPGQPRDQAASGRPGFVDPALARQFSRELRASREAAESLAAELEAEGMDAAALEPVARTMRGLEGGSVFSDPSGLARLGRGVLEPPRAFEYALRRQLGSTPEGQPVVAPGDQVPPRFRAVVEEYYRSLARTRPQRETGRSP